MIDDLTLVDIKPNRGCFTWTNNRKDDRLVEVRLDRFLVSTRWLDKVSFLSTEVFHQVSS